MKLNKVYLVKKLGLLIHRNGQTVRNNIQQILYLKI